MLANLWALRRHLPRRFFSIRDFRDRLSQDEAPESAALSYDELPCCDGNAPLDTDRYRVALAWLPNGSGICLDACSAHPRIDVRQRVTAAGYEYLPIDAREFDGVRREDLTALSFADDSISCILSVDTVEHIPHWRAAVNEMFRVLRPAERRSSTYPVTSSTARQVSRSRFLTSGNTSANSRRASCWPRTRPLGL